MLKELNYIVNGQTLTGESFKMASDTVNEIKVSFVFEGTDWSGLDSIKAVFSNNRVANSYEAVLVNGACTIPHEVLTEKGAVSVNLYGSIITGTTLTTRITSYKSTCGIVLQKVNVSGSNSVVPTPATWQQELSAHTQNTTVHVTANDKTNWNAKSTVSVSDEGTATDEVQYITINGVEKKLAGGGSSGTSWGQITGTLADQEDLVEALSDIEADIPTKTSDLTNDSGFLTSHQDISGKEDKSNKVTSFGATPSDDKYPSEKLVKDSLDGKVSTEQGKGLSENDFTDALKTKLDGIEAGAEVNEVSLADLNAKVNYTDKLSQITGTMSDSEKALVWGKTSNIKTTMDSVAVAGAEYYLGTQSSVAISMPTDAIVGQEILVCFTSGATACTLTCDLEGFSFVPKANKTSWIRFTLYHKADVSVIGDTDSWLVETKEG